MDSTSTFILAITLIIIMLSMGLSAVMDDFTRILKHPKTILLGLIMFGTVAIVTALANKRS